MNAMRRIILAALACTLLSLGAHGQTIQKNDRFWDGITLWEVNAIYGGRTVFMVGTEELYLSLEKVPGKAGEYKLVPSSEADEPSIPGAQFGWRVRYIRQDSMNFLAVCKPGGDIMWTMLLTPDGLDGCIVQEEAIEREIPSDILANTLLNRHYLSKIPNKRELRLMRNEILARHGYRFSSPDLREWFEELDWYKPVDDNKSIKLNIIEQTNVQLIKSEEADRHPVSAASLAGRWEAAGDDVPGLLLVLGTGEYTPLANGLTVETLKLPREDACKNPGLEFDGENILIRKDLGEDRFIFLQLKPYDSCLSGKCVISGLSDKDFDGEVTLRRVSGNSR